MFGVGFVSAVSVKDWDRNGDFSVSRYLSLCLFLGVWTRASVFGLGSVRLDEGCCI